MSAIILNGTVVRGTTRYPAQRIANGGMRMLIIGVWVGVTDSTIAATWEGE